MTSPEPTYPPLSTREIQTLPEGARVIVTSFDMYRRAAHIRGWDSQRRGLRRTSDRTRHPSPTDFKVRLRRSCDSERSRFPPTLRRSLLRQRDRVPHRATRRHAGIPIENTTWRRLGEMAVRFGIPHLDPFRRRDRGTDPQRRHRGGWLNLNPFVGSESRGRPRTCLETWVGAPLP